MHTFNQRIQIEFVKTYQNILDITTNIKVGCILTYLPQSDHFYIFLRFITFF